jgi:hypothetical protein
MARYIKANPKVAVFLRVENERNTVKDGNYLLWQADMLKFGPLTQLNETLAQIGGIALMAHEAREEQDGIVTRPLPRATDPRFIMDGDEPEPEPEAAPANDQPEPEPGNGESVTEGTGEAETPEEQTEAATGGGSEEITAGDVGNVEDIVDFGPEQEPDNGGE